MVQIVTQYLDTTQDTKSLSDAEFNIRHKLKKKLPGWAVIERARTRQFSRINYLQEGDANTRFFHLILNACMRKNFIQRLRTNARWVISHQDKHAVVQQHFASFMSTSNQHSCDINWDRIDLPRVDFSHLERPFNEVDITHAISQLPPDGRWGLTVSHVSFSNSVGPLSKEM
jgi:hypothetical protein